MNITAIKRYLLKGSGLGGFLWSRRRNGLYCFNFHRIGDWHETPYDPCVYSCTQEDLRKYIDFIKGNFRVISLGELSELVRSGSPVQEPLALLTFDDGYRDNFEQAFPVLQEADIPATFFITTSLIESNAVPWWDEIAWHVRQIKDLQLQLSCWDQPVNFSPALDYRDSVRLVLQRIKAASVAVEEQLQELREISGNSLVPDENEPMFMSWEQLRTMADAGMTIGAHSHSHQIFTGLTEEELKFELSHSKQLLEKQIGTEVIALSYPVGNVSTYSSGMFAEIESQGYEIAFSFSALRNVNLSQNRFQIGRFPVDTAFDEHALMVSCLTANSL